MGEYDVTIVKAESSYSVSTGWPIVRLVFSPHGLLFHEGRMVNKIFCGMSNIPRPLPDLRRAKLRSALSRSSASEPLTEEELKSIVGRRIRVSVETVEFEGMKRLRVVDFLRYSGKVKDLNYSDNEYVFMIRELIQEGGK